MDATAQLERDIREQVRNRGLDPVRERATVNALIGEVVAQYDLDARDGRVPKLGNPTELTRHISAAITGLGPLQQYMDDPEVEEIWINRPNQVFVARNGQPELTPTILTAETVARLVEHMLKLTGRRLDLSTPFVDAMLPGGERLHVVIPDITRMETSVNIRKFVARASSLTDLVARGMLPIRAALFLDACVKAGLNILVAGATGAGKTTFLRALLGAVPPSERIITVEEVFELNLTNRDVVAMQCRMANLEGNGEINLRRLVKESLRMRPDRIVVGEVREAECLDLLIALNSGLPGMATLHANSSRDAITKVSTLPLLAGENVTAQFVTPTVAGSIDIVVHVVRDADGARRVAEITAVTGRVEDNMIEMAAIFSSQPAAQPGHPDARRQPEALVRRDGYPPKQELFARAGIDVLALLTQDSPWG